eukprot:COSAG01_NODE_26554_length_710_cov_1.098200_1_plen_33_part_10
MQKKPNLHDFIEKAVKQCRQTRNARDWSEVKTG